MSLLIAAVCAGLHLRLAFSQEFIIHDDARQHVFWALRYLDPGLFPHDRIADYFHDVAPLGYRFVYWLPAQLGVDPFWWGKVLPVLLGVGASALCFRFTAGLFTRTGNSRVADWTPAVAGLLAVGLFNHVMWLKDSVSSGTPRAFHPLLFLAFLGFWLRARPWPALGIVALQGLIYPSMVFTSAGLAALGTVGLAADRRAPWLAFSRRRADWTLALGVLLVAAATLAPFSRQTAPHGPILTGAEARGLSEFALGGRSMFFDPNPAKFWVWNDRSGLMNWPLRLDTVGLALALPLLLLAASWRRASTTPNATDAGAVLDAVDPALLPALGRLALVSGGLFALAHAMLFRLHLPNRYTEPALRVMLPILAAVTLALLAQALWRWARGGDQVEGRGTPIMEPPGRGVSRTAAVLLLAVAALAWHFYENRRKHFPLDPYIRGTQPELYRFLQTQPRATLVASLSNEASVLPSFARRSVLTSREHAIPYHLGYYRGFEERMRALIRVHYSRDPREVAEFVKTYGITHFLVSRRAFQPDYLPGLNWLQAYAAETDAARQSLLADAPGEAGAAAQEAPRFVLERLMQTAPVFATPEMVLISTEPLLRDPSALLN